MKKVGLPNPKDGLFIVLFKIDPNNGGENGKLITNYVKCKDGQR